MPDDRPAAAGSPEEHPPAGSSAAPAAGGQAGSMVRTLTWRDGMVFALNIPIGLFLTLGYTVGALGGWLTILLWGVACLIALLQNTLFAEMAGMFSQRSGGISVYAYEGWKRHFAPLGAIAAFGYWMGWSLSLSVEAVALGTLIHGTFFPDAELSVGLPIGNELGLPYLIGIAAIVIAWALNYFGVRIAAGVAKVVGGLLLLGLLVLVVGPFLSPGVDFDPGRLTWSGASETIDWKVLVVWFYITAWTTYGTELCASFTAEYKDPVRDSALALRRSALMILALYVTVPYVVAGSIGEETIGANPIAYISIAFDHVLGDYGWVGEIPVMAAFVIAMMTATADGGRSLYGIARSGGTVRQLGVLNRHGVPGRALTADMLINILVLVLLGEPIAILLASNFGYLAAVTLAVGAFVLLRRDRPDADRPLRLGPAWVPIAVVLFVFDLFVIVVGLLNPGLTGYGGLTETLSGVGILLLAFVLWYYRNRIQDRTRIRWRDRRDDTVVDGEAGTPRERGSR